MRVLAIIGLMASVTAAVKSPAISIITRDDAAAFIHNAHQEMDRRLNVFEPRLHAEGVRQEPGSPAWFMGISHANKRSTKNLTHVALMAEMATTFMAHTIGVSGDGLAEWQVTGDVLEEHCPSRQSAPWCQPKKYRSLSGYCNNVQSPDWGSASIAYVRYLPSRYADGISFPRGTAVYPKGLPSAREVSLIVHKQMDQRHSHLVATAAFWAQIVSHDLSLTPQMTGYQGERLRCCDVEFKDFHPECFPIRIPEDDPIHGSARCQEYARSATAPRKHCSLVLGPREQLNEATSFLDASNLYGTSVEEAEGLREFKDGRLYMPHNLLASTNSTDCNPHNTYKCFKTGDARVNEQVGLAALVTVLAREHNRLAGELKSLNPSWVDEILFQEARKVLIAQIQHITYKEFLPLILGQDTMDIYRLHTKEGYFEGYDINVDPTVANSVASAALHFSVSLMPPSIKLYNYKGEEIGEDSFSNTFYAPFRLYLPQGLESTIQSLLKVPAMDNQQHVNSVFTDYMYLRPGQNISGLDLVAQLIQRGRDHGIPGYVEWRSFCGLSNVGSFEDLKGEMSDEAIEALSLVYKGNVSDVDLLSGSLSERAVKGGAVGPTLRCLLGKQFVALRAGDRHWYESEHAGFSKAQLRAIREGTSLARLLCDNTEIEGAQPNAFIAEDPFLNSVMSCTDGSIKSLDLTPWRENRRQFFIPPLALADSLNQATVDLSKLHAREWQLHIENKMADPQSPIGTAFGFNRPRRQAAIIANTSFMLEFASSRIVRSFIQGEFEDVERGSIEHLVSALPSIELGLDEDTRKLECLESELPCDYTSGYRTFSGWCNNLDNPNFGQSFRPFNRYLPPVYSDGIGTPRSQSVTGKPLPSPRLVSTRVHTDSPNPHTRYSLMVMQFSQITDHDLTFTPVNKGFVGEGILNCKSCDSKVTVHPECFPIPIPSNDPFFPSKDRFGKPVCIPATRSMPGQLTLGPREQMNQLTAYLDLSFMYGSDTCQAQKLRAFTGGKLNVTWNRNLKPLLPETATNPECRSPSRICFNAGDDRSSEQPGLTSFHTVWLREHNRMAAELSSLNAHWNDEKVYQEVRKILGGVYQNVAFSEWLVRILGRPAVRRYGLDLLSDGYYKGYDPTCDVTIINEFSSAAFRFGHSLLRPAFRRVNANYKEVNSPIRLRDHFFNSQIIYKKDVLNDIILGLIDTPMETLDNLITNEVTDHLFENRTVAFSGMDLIALNIQRARDHGVHPYNDYREACGMKRASNFEDLADTTRPEMIAALAEVYGHVDDIDLFPGAMTETSLSGGVVGPTMACLIADQFSRIRRCDRFWYENDGEFTRFTPLQLNEIRKSSLASLICNNLDSVLTVQRQVLDLPHDFMNPRVACSSIYTMDLTPWRDTVSCSVKGVNIDLGRTSHVSPCSSCTCTKEGPICQSVKVKNCLAILEKFGADKVAKDSACKVQCLYVFKVLKGKLPPTEEDS